MKISLILLSILFLSGCSDRDNTAYSSIQVRDMGIHTVSNVGDHTIICNKTDGNCKC